MAQAHVVLVQGEREVSLGPIGRAGRCDLGLVDDLARLQLAARKMGWSIRLRWASGELSELLVLAGLADIIRCPPAGGR